MGASCTTCTTKETDKTEFNSGRPSMQYGMHDQYKNRRISIVKQSPLKQSQVQQQEGKQRISIIIKQDQQQAQQLDYFSFNENPEHLSDSTGRPSTHNRKKQNSGYGYMPDASPNQSIQDFDNINQFSNPDQDPFDQSDYQDTDQQIIIEIDEIQQQYVGRASDPSKFTGNITKNSSANSSSQNYYDCQENSYNADRISKADSSVLQSLYLKAVNDDDPDFQQVPGIQHMLSEIEEEGEYVFQNGAVYQGQWKGNQRHGYGVQQWPDGAKYEGFWKDNKAHGKGTFYHVDGDVFEGEWECDKANGYGVYMHANGARYEGYWKNDLQEGYGVETWVDGSRYEGYYIKGQKQGQGTYQWNDGSTYEGEWIDNKINGHGIYKWIDGRIYEGDWVDNQMQGNGVYRWPDGRVYQGDYFADKKHGFGIYNWPDGRVYEGLWKEGKQHGEGKYTNQKGEIRFGIWENGKRTKWVKEIKNRWKN